MIHNRSWRTLAIHLSVDVEVVNQLNKISLAIWCKNSKYNISLENTQMLSSNL